MQNVRALARIVLAAGCVALLGGAAKAQSILVSKPFTVKVGNRSPIGGSDSYFYAGASFAYGKSNAPIPAAGYALYQVYIDYAARRISFVTGNSGTPHATERSVGVGPSIAYHFGPAIAPIHPYIGAGVGYYNVKVYNASTSGRPGGKVFAGVELKSGFLGEVDYTTVGKVGGENTGGLGVRLGYRF